MQKLRYLSNRFDTRALGGKKKRRHIIIPQNGQRCRKKASLSKEHLTRQVRQKGGSFQTQGMLYSKAIVLVGRVKGQDREPPVRFVFSE